ncbi:hypothetical protein BD770DRAFT_431181 [Pilaira anomala]|nr:hypothetical protein BD770DRAFT_431181 [Pilaira anomala]
MDHLNQQQKDPTKKINIGIILSFEKKLLESSIGAKDDLKKIVYKSGWKQYKLKFPIKTCALLAQLHEDYVQLALKQMATEDEIQEAITLEDEIISTHVIQVCRDHNENVSLSVRDIINISFKPFLRDIASVVSTLLTTSTYLCEFTGRRDVLL